MHTRCGDTVEALLDLTVIQSGVKVQKLVSVSALMDEAVLAQLGSCSELGVVVTVAASAEAGVAIEERLLRIAVGNLVENAVRHNIPGGRIAVSLEEDVAWVELCIANSGSRVGQGDVEELAEPFVRTVMRTGRVQADGERAGSGLTIARVIALA